MPYDILDRLYKLAEGQDGFFTTRQAAAEGVGRQAIAQAEGRGALERYDRGIYRLMRYPFAGTNAQLWPAVLWPQSRSVVPAVLSHETALRLHDLSDANPDRVHITIPPNIRLQREVPRWLRVHQADVGDADRELADGLPVTTIARTLQDLLDAKHPKIPIIHDALRDAEKRGYRIPDAIKARIAAV